jgi:hypothetical protein
MGIKELAALIGREAQYDSGTGLTFRVLIRDARQAFGRLDYQIEPVGGSGLQWVKADRVRPDESPAR